MMYENRFSTDRMQVLEWATKNAHAACRLCEGSVERKRKDLQEEEEELAEWRENSRKLAALAYSLEPEAHQ